MQTTGVRVEAGRPAPRNAEASLFLKRGLVVAPSSEVGGRQAPQRPDFQELSGCTQGSEPPLGPVPMPVNVSLTGYWESEAKGG